MKKKKYKKLTQDLYVDENLITFLENEAKNGWFLKNIHLNIMVFQQDIPQTLKYQIDYNKPSNEYSDIISDLGYHCACIYKDKYIYYNEDIHADDLQTDLSANLLSMISFYGPKKIAFYLYFCIFFSMNVYSLFNEMYYRFYRHSLAQFFQHTNYYILISVYLILVLSYLLEAIYTLIMNRYYHKMLDEPYNNIKQNMTFIKILEFLDIVTVVSLLILVLYIIPIPQDIKLIFCISIFIFIFIFYIFSTHRYYKIIQTVVVICLVASGIYLVQSQVLKIESIDQPLYLENRVESYFIDENEDIFSHIKYIQIYSDYYEKYVICLNDDIADIIFKEEIVMVEHEYRRDVYVDDSIAMNQPYDIKNIVYYSYEDALKQMKRYETTLVDTCYYNERYMVCMKDHYVLTCEIQDDDHFIDHVLNYYF